MNNKTMMARAHLLAEVEAAKSLNKMTPEERRDEVRRRTHVELRAMEMERRQRVAEKTNRDREERERVRRQREKVEEEKMRLEAREKKERKQELGHPSTVKDKAGPVSLTSDLKSAGIKKQPLHNNWIEEEKTHHNNSVYKLFAAKPGPKPEEKTKTPKPKCRDHKEKKDEKHKRNTKQPRKKAFPAE
ncbi:caldesmon-like [Centropristis striata]|uniref:caldesmon-like n=1 Tax=Centropristis striata TaxID=184440 RepID=UPI0027DEE601|nr:caldesmon-like [Centropristis striata]